MSTLNYDFIAALHIADGRLTYKRHTIDRPGSLIADLERMRDDKNCSVFDMMKCMKAYYMRLRKPINYCYHSELSSSYVPLAVFPIISSEEAKDYVKQAKEVKKRIKNEYLQLVESKLLSEEEYEHAVERNTESYMVEFGAHHKDEFYKRAIRYIDASSYNRALKNLKKDSSVVLASTATTGHHSETFALGEDFYINLTTNFGAGKHSSISTYITYKGNNIVFFSKFYDSILNGELPPFLSAHFDLATDQAYDESLQLIASAGDLYLQDKDKFEEEYIIKEISTMMTLLDTFMDNPMTETEKIYAAHRQNHSSKDSLIESFIYAPDLVCSYYRFLALVYAGLSIRDLRMLSNISENVKAAAFSALRKMDLYAIECIPEIYSDIESLECETERIRQELIGMEKQIMFSSTNSNNIDQKIKSLSEDLNIKERLLTYLHALEKTVRKTWGKGSLNLMFP